MITNRPDLAHLVNLPGQDISRIEAIASTAELVRRNITANGGAYSGLMVPNLQSVIDLCALPDDSPHLADLRVKLADLWAQKPPMFCQS